MNCPDCGTENKAGAKFCGACGAPLARSCPACGEPYDAGQSFCNECGAALEEAPAQPPAAAAREGRSSERRLVSVLFADLVGFTALSESWDAEETRELLSRYFDSCSRIVSLYGGTVEKFIGDAVMAVWGTPVAQEDDAERAVRAALDLVRAVPELDLNLKARAGVLTGEAAVTIGAEGQGMVAGDLVNTASRIQSTAEAGTVLVGESTKRATEAAIAYADAGVHELKGKAEPVPIFRTLRVTAARGGARKSEGLEPPFVGRDRELRLVKELFHSSSEDGRAHLVSVIGIAGIGKSRLAWEFEKYVDGLLDLAWWHRGRCLAYGEGVAYWALGEMVRMRAGISEAESTASATAKLEASLEEHISDPDERSWLEPRLAHLLGLAERTAPDREDLFSAWRLFFERLSETHPTVLVFEDLQWADASLLDFLEYLLDWSRDHPLFVLALARPELSERRPGWGAGGRTATTLLLEPLSGPAMEELLDGFVPGLAPELRAQILERAEGVPLYAVETVRMLLDRGLLEREGDVYRVTGTVEALEVPETLHALIAARLDGLTPGERRVLQDAAVLGKSFTRTGLAALSGLSEAELEPLTTSLIRKEVLSLQADPRSPERGQYAFLQDLLKRVAYETLSKKDRKARHLAAAAHLEQAWDSAEEEVVEVVAAHYLDAYRAAPDADDAPEIKAKARERLAGAGERAASLAASGEAQHYFEQAAELCDDPLQRAGLLERAAEMALQAGRIEESIAHFEQAIELFRAEGATHPAARAAAGLGMALYQSGEIEAGAERAEESLQVLADDEPDADLAALAAEIARLRFFLGDAERARERVERALEIAEALYLPDVLAQALNTKHLILDSEGRPEEGLALLERAVTISREHELGAPQLRALYNLSHEVSSRDRLHEARDLDLEALELARKRGDRGWERLCLGHLMGRHFVLGDWDEVLRIAAEVEEIAPGVAMLDRGLVMSWLHVLRGDLADARHALEGYAHPASSADLQARAIEALAHAIVLRAEGKPRDALGFADAALAERPTVGARHVYVKWALVEAVEAAFDLDDLDRVDQLLAELRHMRPSDRTPLVEAHAHRFDARLASQRGEGDDAEPGLMRATGLFRELGTPFYLAVSLLEHAEWLAERARLDEAEPLVAEAREIFERLQARPWLERASSVGREPEAVTARS